MVYIYEAEAEGAETKTIEIKDCMFVYMYTISVVRREDGGLRIWSDDVPGLLLSGADPSAVWRDLGPAIQTLLSHNTAREPQPSDSID